MNWFPLMTNLRVSRQYRVVLPRTMDALALVVPLED